jgi:P2-related tail formation protein
MSRYDLLPPNATTLERDFSRSTSSLQRAGQPVPIIRTAKRVNIPDSVVPWLIYEYGLGEILPYLGNNQRRAIAEGVLWQRIRGTPEAVRIALGWIGVEGLIDESEGGSARWAEYQLGLSAGTTGEQIIDDIVGVTRISSPVRSRLQRIYAVYDFRRFVLDSSLLSDGGMLSDHSGMRPRPDWPQISYGEIHSSLVQENATVASAHTDVIGVLVRNFDRFLLDHSLMDEEWHTLNNPGMLTNQEGVSGKYEGQTWAAFTWRSDLTWLNANVVASSSVTTQTA